MIQKGCSLYPIMLEDFKSSMEYWKIQQLMEYMRNNPFIYSAILYGLLFFNYRYCESLLYILRLKFEYL